MTTNTPFIQLFSDQAASPRPEYIAALETSFMSKSLAGVKKPRLSTKAKIVIGVVIAVVLGAILALVFLPKRDMTDPSKDSLIESVVTGSQDSISSFTNPATDAEVNKQEVATPSNPATPSTVTPTNTQVANTSQLPAVLPVPQAPVPLTNFVAEYWNLTKNLGSPLMPISAPLYTANIDAISFNWGSGSPAPGVINADAFVARYTKDTVIEHGQYKVVFSSDNGLRMHVNETVVFDHWNDGVGGGTAYFNTDPSLPTTSILIEYHEMAADAQVQVTITKI